jgi:hypothetical protein
MKLSDLGNVDKGDILSALGLADQRSAARQLWGSVGIFAVGLLVGAGAALLLAPTSGQGLREGLAERLRKARDGAVDEGDASDVPEAAAVHGEART